MLTISKVMDKDLIRSLQIEYPHLSGSKKKINKKNNNKNKTTCSCFAPMFLLTIFQ